MTTSDFLFVFQWWLTIAVIGFIFLPMTFLLFSYFFDRGYSFAKVLGIGILSYCVFVLGILHIFSFTRNSILLILVLLAGIQFLIYIRNKTVISTFVKQHWRLFLFEEAVCFVGLLLWSYIRAFAPDIHGLEKYMDFGFVNSILRASYFPPKDMWFTPFPINYYYFGHFMTAVLTKLTNIPSFITFNLIIATLFALTFIASFSLGANLWYFLEKQLYNSKKYSLFVFVTGFVSAFLVTLGGNLHTIYAFFKSYGNDNPLPLWELPFMPQSFPNAYWYPNATRFIYHTIHEFPMYSFVVSDLHGHVIDIPFVLLTIAVLLSLIFNFQFSISNHIHTSKNQNTKHIGHLPFSTWHFILIGFLLAVMYMTNAWDGLIYFLLASTVIGLLIFSQYAKQKSIDTDTSFLIIFVQKIIILFGLFIFFALPFSFFFHVGSIAHGIGVLCAPTFLTNIGKIGPFLFEANHCQHSPWWQLVTLYGFFYFWAASFVIFVLNKNNKKTIADIFILILIGIATLLIILPEFVYLKDIYPEHYRANTMFKLVYQSFIMLSLSSAYIIFRIVFSSKYLIFTITNKILYTIYVILAVIVTALVALYPYFAITSYYGTLQTYYGLDGTKYIKNLYPTDYDAIVWINEHINRQPVILEAQGDSYTDYARISANTGLPTVLGWTVHEWLWRGTYDIPAPRITEINNLYESTDIALTKQLIEKYHISLVFIGDLERKKYQNLNEEKFNTLGKIVYHNGQTTIYQLSP